MVLGPTVLGMGEFQEFFPGVYDLLICKTDGNTRIKCSNMSETSKGVGEDDSHLSSPFKMAILNFAFL